MHLNKNIALSALTLSLRRSVPVMIQTESAECGLACLTMIASYYGKNTNLLALRQEFGISSRGATLETLTGIATALKLGFRALSLEMDEVDKLKLPCIIHWGFNHFVVLVKVTRHNLTINDPAVGKRVISRDQFSKLFTGVALELWPDAGFVKNKNKILIQTRELINNISGFKSALVKIFLISLLIEMISLLVPIGTQLVMDHVIPAMDFGLLKLICIGLFILTLSQTFVLLWRSWSVIILDTLTHVQWSDSLFHHLIRLPLVWFDKRKIGDIQSRFESLNNLRLTFIHDITGSIMNIIMTIGALAMLIQYGGGLSFVVIGFTSFYIALRLCTFSRYKQLSEESIIRQAGASSFLTETLYGISTLRAQGLTERRRSRWVTLMMSSVNASINVDKFNMFFQVVSTFIGTCDNIVILWLGIGMVMEREMTLGAFVAFGTFRGLFSDRLLSLTDILLNFKIQSLHNERVSDIALASIEPESGISEVFKVSGAMTLSLKNISFQYDKISPRTLHEISFTVNRGESIAIVGPSGCGKTTLMKIMAGLIRPDTGEIIAAGYDIHTAGVNNYRKGIACILQEDRLFAGSLRENITGFAEKVDEEWLIKCTRLSHIHDDILHLPMGYDTFIGELGEGLSGGQRQRIFIARALYRQPGILFMDEATSHLDEENEKMINEAISALDMTRIIIAHRPSTIASADRVIRLNKNTGRLANDCNSEPT
ncbi:MULTISPECIES: peptidase domain-containing ABC transporter [unclassified Serratia (in: enterobacteria)]|uniref:peptidase domain-containing ABC transporter n=1 Tax=unclassified Serratia (in: enterobacteria) TaxID=2647522 RepID=UPI003075FA3B